MDKLPVAILSLTAFMGGAASSPSTNDQPKFEVISIKPTPKERFYRLKRECSDDRFVAAGMPLLFIIGWSYDLSDNRIAGLPEWVNAWEAAYDFEAKAAGPMTQGQCKLMVQSLLADRFKMAVHRETREIPVFLLVVGKHGPKLQQASNGSPGRADGVRINGTLQQALDESEPAKGWSTARLARLLSDRREIGRPVIDKTGLAGVYSFSLTFSLKDEDDRPSIFTAVEDQLGLKLVPTKAPLEVLVVDHIERASEN